MSLPKDGGGWVLIGRNEQRFRFPAFVRSFKRLPNEPFAVLGPFILGEVLVDSD
jgi:hypothetical protein